MIEQEKAIFIEYCTNCNSHIWCTKHDESRYSGFFSIIKQELEMHFPGVTIYSNTNPLTGKPIIPSLGAFEVYYMKRKVFSKLKTSSWPIASLVSSKVKSIIEGNVPEDCEIVDYAYGDMMTEKKRRTIRIQKQLKRTFDTQTTSTRNNFYPSTLSSIPTENQQQEIRSFCWDKNCREKINSFIDVERKINKRATASVRPDKNNIKVFSQTMYANNQGQLKASKKMYPQINNENYYLPTTKVRFGKSAIKNGAPQSLNEMSLSLQTMTDFNNILTSCPESVNNKEDALSIKKTARNERKMDNLGRLVPLLNSANKTSNVKNLKTDKLLNRKEQRSHSQDMTPIDLDQELNESTVFSQRIKESSVVKNKINERKKGHKELQWFPDNLSHRSSPENFEEKIQNNTKLNPKSNNTGNEFELIDPIFSNEVQDWTGRENDIIVSKLRNLTFPDEKLSQIRIVGKTLTKKKITMIPDEKHDCKIELYFTHPQINGLLSQKFVVAKGCPFKIPLKFSYQEIKFLTGFCIFILKNDRPWQKIMLDLSFL